MSRLVHCLRLLAVLIVFACARTCEAATQKVIIDVDGSVESMTALATLVAHPTTSQGILLITVTGTGWATLTAAENNVRALLKLANRDDIPVGVGTSSTLGGQPDASAVEKDPNAPGGSCDDSKFFPPTAAMALARGLKRSRYDEDDLYGAADALPTPTNFGTKSKESTTQMSTILNQYSDTAHFAYIATTSLTNLARFFKNGNANAITTFVTYGDIHIYENGNNLPIDSAATLAVLEKQMGISGLTMKMYTPSMLAPIRYSQSSWNSMRLASQSSGVKAYAGWVIKAIQGRKNALDGGIDAVSSIFYTKDTSMEAAFVVMAVADTETKTAGSGLLTATADNKKVIQYNTSVVAVKAGVGSLTLYGNNVTRGGFMGLVPIAPASPLGVIVITDPATKLSTGQQTSMADTFWTRWRSIMFS